MPRTTSMVPQGHDEGHHLEPRDQRAVERAATHAGGDARQRGEHGRRAGAQEGGDDHGGERDDRPDGKIDAAGHDHDRPHQRGHGHDRGLAKDGLLELAGSTKLSPRVPASNAENSAKNFAARPAGAARNSRAPWRRRQARVHPCHPAAAFHGQRPATPVTGGAGECGVGARVGARAHAASLPSAASYKGKACSSSSATESRQAERHALRRPRCDHRGTHTQRLRQIADTTMTNFAGRSASPPARR